MDFEIINGIAGVIMASWGIVVSAKDRSVQVLKKELVSFKLQYIEDVHRSNVYIEKIRHRQKVILYQNKDLQNELSRTCKDMDDKLNDVRLDIARFGK